MIIGISLLLPMDVWKVFGFSLVCLGVQVGGVQDTWFYTLSVGERWTESQDS